MTESMLLHAQHIFKDILKYTFLSVVVPSEVLSEVHYFSYYFHSADEFTQK